MYIVFFIALEEAILFGVEVLLKNKIKLWNKIS